MLQTHLSRFYDRLKPTFIQIPDKILTTLERTRRIKTSEIDRSQTRKNANIEEKKKQERKIEIKKCFLMKLK
jgi:hypothetical protein